MSGSGAPGVDLWLLDTDTVSDASRAWQACGELPTEERAQAARFHFERDRRRHLLTRVALRHVLARYAPVAPQDWRFQLNAYGKPAPCPGLTLQAPLHFNVSHAGAMIAIAVTRGGEIGVDIEEAQGRPAPLEIAPEFFAAAEAAALAALPESERHLRFYELWTLKEAYIKARGMGLSLPLHDFSFDLRNTGAIGFALGDAQADRERRHFLQFDTGAYLLAVCMTGHEVPACLRARMLVSDLSEREAALTLRRTSRRAAA